MLDGFVGVHWSAPRGLPRICVVTVGLCPPTSFRELYSKLAVTGVCHGLSESLQYVYAGNNYTRHLELQCGIAHSSYHM